MVDLVVFVGVWAAVLTGAVIGSRGMERAFQLFGEYQAGPRPYPDQDGG